jgi:hypothetical protein
LVAFFGLPWHLKALVSSAQRNSFDTKEVGIFLVYNFIFRMMRVDCCNCLVNWIHIGGVVACCAKGVIACFDVQQWLRKSDCCAHGHGNVPYQLVHAMGSCTQWACARVNFTTPSSTSTSTRDISTTMAPIDNAIADLELPEEGADFTVTQIADGHGVNRSTLS